MLKSSVEIQQRPFQIEQILLSLLLYIQNIYCNLPINPKKQVNQHWSIFGETSKDSSPKSA